MPFASIVGHATLIELLRLAVERDRVPQSLIFAGPEGVGKRAVATALAQAVNCPSRRVGDACGVCSTCTRVAGGRHSDVTWLQKGAEKSIKIKALRERVLESVGYRPFEASRRVYVIEPADEMTTEAQDSLLKTLEEPPSAAIIILVTAYADTLLPTIRSRCRRLRFGLLAEADVARVLTERAGIDRAEARVLASASGGSVARALASVQGDLEDDRAAALGLLDAARGRLVTVRLKAAAALTQHGSKRRDREALAARLATVQSLLRDVALLGTGASTSLATGAATLLANGDLEADLRMLVPAFDASRVSAAYAALTRAQQDLDRNASPKIVADWVSVTL
jgi:DNA polymerase-3 subunit delta'